LHGSVLAQKELQCVYPGYPGRQIGVITGH